MWAGQLLTPKLIKWTVVIINWLQLIAEVSFHTLAGDCSPEVPKALQSQDSSTWGIPDPTISSLCFKLHPEPQSRAAIPSSPSLQLHIFRFPAVILASPFLQLRSSNIQYFLTPLPVYIRLFWLQKNPQQDTTAQWDLTHTKAHMLCVFMDLHRLNSPSKQHTSDSLVI